MDSTIHGEPSPLPISSLPRALPTGRPRHEPYPIERAVQGAVDLGIFAVGLAIVVGQDIAAGLPGARVAVWAAWGRVRQAWEATR